jgi:tRNA(Ile)-lysidine synthase
MAPLGPFGDRPHLAAGVSGGPHSLALAMLTRDWLRSRSGRLTALVVDHGLRAGSAIEATNAATLLAHLGITTEVLTLNLSGNGAVQERARDARLQALLARCATLGAPWLLLGHHRGDQAETVLFRALRGSGAAGLAGMTPCRGAAEALVLRPLLPVPPGEIEEYLKANGVEPFRDPSNQNLDFARVRLRAAMRDAAGRGAGTDALLAAGAAFAGRRRRQEIAVAERLARALAWQPGGWARLDAAALGSDGVAVAAMAGLLRLLGGAAHAPAVGAVGAMLRRGGGTLHGVLWQGGILCREPAACAPPVEAVPGAIWDGRWQAVSCPPGCRLAALGAFRPLRNRLPARVLAALPALWREDAVLAVPSLGFGPPAELRPVAPGGLLGTILRAEARIEGTTWFQNAT